MTEKLNKLERIAKELKFKVIYANKTGCCIDDRELFIPAKRKTKTKIFLLAHELGHARTMKACHLVFGEKGIYDQESTARKEVEIMAWTEADKIIKEIDMYGKAYLACKHLHLRTYYN